MSRAHSILSKLPLAVEPEKPTFNQTTHRRNKLLDRLREQREMARCMIEGEHFEVTKKRWIADDETGLRKQVSLPKQVRQWYYTIDDNMYFEVRYGNKPLELAKGKAAINVGDIDKLLGVIDRVIKAVEAGELDEMLLAIRKVGAKK